MRTIIITMVVTILLLSVEVVTAFMPHQPLVVTVSNSHTVSTSTSSSSLRMVLEKPRVKEIAKIEQLKVDSNYLVHPLQEVTFFTFVVFFCGSYCC